MTNDARGRQADGAGEAVQSPPGLPAWAQAAVILAVCAGVYWLWLGRAGLTMSEGHRVVPGWEMLGGGGLKALPTMFEQAYLRKPPGMAWAIAASGWVLGQTEFAARAVSAVAATVAALAAGWFARRWFGARWGVFAGCAQALMPVWWSPGRSAEIEMLHLVCVQVAGLVMMDRWLRRALVHDRPAGGLFTVGGLAALAAVALGVTGALLTKGPAGAPVWAGCAAAVVLATRRTRGWFDGPVLAGLVLGLGLVGLWGWRAAAAVGALGADRVVTQTPGEFLWDLTRWREIMGLAPMTLATGLPMTVFLLAVVRPGAARDAASELRLRAARALVVATLVSVGLYVVLGVSNPRYAWPALMLTAPVVAFGIRDLKERAREGLDWSQRLMRMIVARPEVVLLALLIAAGAWMAITEPQRERSSGRAAGRMLGAALVEMERERGAPVEVWANDAVEARPEVLWYAAQEAELEGRKPRLRWMPGLEAAPAGTLVLLRLDEGAAEAGWAARARLAETERRLTPVPAGAPYRGRAAQFEFGLFEVGGE